MNVNMMEIPRKSNNQRQRTAAYKAKKRTPT